MSLRFAKPAIDGRFRGHVGEILDHQQQKCGDDYNPLSKHITVDWSLTANGISAIYHKGMVTVERSEDPGRECL
jgi:hypothetical protein